MKLNRKPPAEQTVVAKKKLNRKPPQHPIINSHWDIVVMSPVSCFVCDKKFKAGQRKISIGPGLMRHEGCDSNSANWQKKFRYCKTLGR
jgi:hypothetical protein